MKFCSRLLAVFRVYIHRNFILESTTKNSGIKYALVVFILLTFIARVCRRFVRVLSNDAHHIRCFRMKEEKSSRDMTSSSEDISAIKNVKLSLVDTTT